MQQYYKLKCFVSRSEQKESWLDAWRDTWCVTSEVEYFDWFKKHGSVNLSIRFLQLNNDLFKRCHSLPKPVKIRFCTVQYRCIFGLAMVFWTLLKELDNNNVFL